MSILLEALKKSAQERQLGQVPTLQNRPDDPARSHQPLNPWMLLPMIVLSVCVMAWFGWQQFQQAPGEEVPVVAIQAGDDEAGPAEESPQMRTKTESYRAENERRQPLPLNPRASRDRDKVVRSVSDYKAENDEPAPAAQAERVVATAEPAPGAAADPATAETEAPAATQEEQPRRGIEPHVTEPISYWELPQGIRDNLPEIKITVLVYAEHPDDRFLLSNGQRMVEKDELDGGLVLDEIRKDGAIFLYRNYRFLVKS
jgi:general secretion pathway protein B